MLCNVSDAQAVVSIFIIIIINPKIDYKRKKNEAAAWKFM